MKEEIQLQDRLFSDLKKMLGGKNYVEDIAELLGLSPDSIYRRVRCETALSIVELQKILIEYDLSLDDYLDSSARRVSFTFQPIKEDDFTFTQYLSFIKTNMERVVQSEDRHMMYFAKDIPLFQLMNAPALAHFKLFFWRKTVLDFKSFKTKKFSFEDRDEQINDISRLIRDYYYKVSATEIYSPDTIDTSLNEIEYFYDSGHFTNPKDAIVVLESLSGLVEHIRSQCEYGFRYKRKKDGAVEPPADHANISYKVLYNEILFTDATILVRLDDQKWSYLANNGLNVLSTKDENFYNSCYEAFQVLERRSTLISGNSEKERNKVFNRYQQRINHVKQRLEQEMARQNNYQGAMG